MKITENLDWEVNPCIWVEHGSFEINIDRDEVEIICDWDYGYGGRGTESIFINRNMLIKLLSKMDKI